MNVTEARYANFATLFRQFREEHADKPDKGMLKLFAEKLDLSPRYLSHIKCERKPIGHATARQIELRMDKAEGWMDQANHPDMPPLETAEQAFVRMALLLFRADSRAATDVVLSALERHQSSVMSA